MTDALHDFAKFAIEHGWKESPRSQHFSAVYLGGASNTDVVHTIDADFSMTGTLAKLWIDGYVYRGADKYRTAELFIMTRHLLSPGTIVSVGRDGRTMFGRVLRSGTRALRPISDDNPATILDRWPPKSRMIAVQWDGDLEPRWETAEELNR